MTIASPPAPKLSASESYSRLVALGDDGQVYVSWAVLAADLRSAAANAGSRGQRDQLLDRAADCDRRAVRQHRDTADRQAVAS
jgi:hypothetical protein